MKREGGDLSACGAVAKVEDQGKNHRGVGHREAGEKGPRPGCFGGDAVKIGQPGARAADIHKNGRHLDRSVKAGMHDDKRRSDAKARHVRDGVDVDAEVLLLGGEVAFAGDVAVKEVANPRVDKADRSVGDVLVGGEVDTEAREDQTAEGYKSGWVKVPDKREGFLRGGRCFHDVLSKRGGGVANETRLPRTGAERKLGRTRMMELLGIFPAPLKGSCWRSRGVWVISLSTKGEGRGNTIDESW